MSIDNILNGQTIMQKTIDFSGYEKSINLVIISSIVLFLCIIVSIIVLKKVNDGINYKIDAVILLMLSIISSVMLVVGVKNYFMKKAVEDVMDSSQVIIYRVSSTDSRRIEQLTDNFYIIKEEAPIYYVADIKLQNINNNAAKNKIMDCINENW